MSTDGYFTTLVDYAPDAMVVFDQHGVISYANKQAERLFGYEAAELRESSLTRIVPTGLSERPSPGTPNLLTVDGQSKAGRTLPVQVAVARIEAATGPQFTAAFRSREPALADSVRPARSEFLASTSHELRSPLNVIIGFAKLMYRGRVGDVSDAQREYLGDILDSAEQLLELINDLVDLLKLEAGRMEFQPEPVNLMLLLHEVQESIDSFARAKNIALDVEAAPDCSDVELDPDKLRQVLLNLSSQALRLMADGGTLKLHARSQGRDHVRFEVSGLTGESVLQKPDAGLRATLTRRLIEQQGGSVERGHDGGLEVLWPRQPTGMMRNLDPRVEAT